MTSRFNDPWNKAIDGADSPQDGMQRQDVERILQPGAHDFPPTIKFPAIIELNVIADCKDHEVLIERGKDNRVFVKAGEINGLVAMLLKAKDLFGECSGK